MAGYYLCIPASFLRQHRFATVISQSLSIAKSQIPRRLDIGQERTPWIYSSRTSHPGCVHYINTFPIGSRVYSICQNEKCFTFSSLIKQLPHTMSQRMATRRKFPMPPAKVACLHWYISFLLPFNIYF